MSDSNGIRYPSVEDVLEIHEVIVEQSDDTTAGVSKIGQVEYTVEFLRKGRPGNSTETLHEKGYQLLRLLVANHPFVDGNKRTALATTVLFYALNGIEFEYDGEVKRILKAFGTDESEVAQARVRSYLEAHTSRLDEDLESVLESALRE